MWKLAIQGTSPSVLLEKGFLVKLLQDGVLMIIPVCWGYRFTEQISLVSVVTFCISFMRWNIETEAVSTNTPVVFFPPICSQPTRFCTRCAGQALGDRTEWKFHPSSCPESSYSLQRQVRQYGRWGLGTDNVKGSLAPGVLPPDVFFLI